MIMQGREYLFNMDCPRNLCSMPVNQKDNNLHNKNWEKYTFEDIFDIRSGKRLETRNKIPGNRPFIGASDSNNGITGFVNNTNDSLDRNSLGVSYNGAPCIAFYHPYECIFTDDVKHLHLKCHNDNEFVHLFLATVISKQKGKYSYGYKFNEQRMRRQIILLPINKNGDPDYEYMESYVRMKESDLIKRYLGYSKSKPTKENNEDSKNEV